MSSRARRAPVAAASAPADVPPRAQALAPTPSASEQIACKEDDTKASEETPGKIAGLALRGADLLGQAADRLVAGGWIETGLIVLLVGRAFVAGHMVVRKAQRDGRKARLLDISPPARSDGNVSHTPATDTPPGPPP